MWAIVTDGLHCRYSCATLGSRRIGDDDNDCLSMKKIGRLKEAKDVEDDWRKMSRIEREFVGLTFCKMVQGETLRGGVKAPIREIDPGARRIHFARGRIAFVFS